jgi:protease PrsW
VSGPTEPPPGSPVPHHLPPGAPVPGWYPDPAGPRLERWWDGQRWSAHVRDGARRRLPRWLSVPVLAAGVVVVPLTVLAFVFVPVVLALTALPLALVYTTFVWLDRIEPEPWTARLHATLWGATVAALGAGIVNSLTAAIGGDALALVVSAPVVEETLKAAGVLFAATRRREVNSAMDGIVFAGWVAAGFAATENVLYLVEGAGIGVGELTATFVVRGLLTPFAHPLFTLPVGLAVGWAVSQRRSLWGWAAIGLVPAVLAHALWNGTTLVATDAAGSAVAVVLVLGFVGLFLGCAVGLAVARGRRARRFVQLVPMLTARYGLRHEELVAFSDWRRLLATRRRLPDRATRRRFDTVHGAVARLAALHDRPGGPTSDEERRALAELSAARLGAPIP